MLFLSPVFRTEPEPDMPARRSEPRRARVRALAGSLLACTWLGPGCSAIVDASLAQVQCTTDADCARLGAAFTNATCVDQLCHAFDAWGCADHPLLTSASSAPVGVAFTLFDAVARGPLIGASAALCMKLDLECEAPVSRTQSDPNGVVYFDMTPLFDGYVQVKAEGYDPALIFLPPTVSPVDLGMFPLASVAATAALGAQLGKRVEPGTGRLLVRVADCSMHDAGDVIVTGESLGDAAVRFYAVSGIPSFTATATDRDGIAGFFNVAPGPITLHAELDDGRPVGRVGLFTRPDVVTMRRMDPWSD